MHDRALVPLAGLALAGIALATRPGEEPAGRVDAHWAWSPPAPSAPPAVDAAHPIDRFVRARLAREGLAPSPPAAPAILLRRLTLDLTGLPPDPADVSAFVADPSEEAYAAAVDRLLDDPGYGEHMARGWLDLARYADTQGYEKDGARNVWRWRDWVIDAFQADLPFDRFTIEQLAGDLLPDATPDQVLATAFHRNTMTNDEGGTDDEEFRVAAVVDRVNTTMQAWMGLTMGCAQCHDHKVDPFTQQEYYRLFAFFDQTADVDRADDYPTLLEPTPREARRLEEMRARTRALEAAFVAPDPALDAAQRAWEAEVLARLDAGEPSPEGLPSGLARLLRTPRGSRPADQTLHLLRYYRGHHVPRFRDHAARLAGLRSSVPRQYGPTPILRELPEDRRRTTRVLHRGSFLDPGEVVAPDVPALFPPLAEGPRDRLALARWLVSADNPLTARVAVNRVWAQLFRRGLVETAEDFGLRGARPSHPELLDWLARRFVADGWSTKALLHTIVTSETYRQSSDLRPDLAARDPQNALLARGPRARLDAEVIRDQALAVAGLLSEKRWGPPVFPPQPEGLWRVVYSDATWRTSEAPDRWRRGLYTFWRRTQPYPSAVLFDAPTREVCVSRRHRTNTPLQALVLLNDPVFVEAAEALGRRARTDFDGDDEARVDGLFRLALARAPSRAELDRLTEFLATERREQTLDLLEAGPDAGVPQGLRARWPEPAEAAAWTALAHLILNLDEFLAPR